MKSSIGEPVRDCPESSSGQAIWPFKNKLYHMKKILLTLIFCVSFAFLSQAQWTVSYHQSDLPFLGINKQLGEKWIPEFRLGANNFTRFLSLELVANYMVKSDEDLQIYLGFGGRANLFPGLVFPAGINYYPFAKKEFGFHFEAAPLVSFQNGALLRGSLGFRYVFLKN